MTICYSSHSGTSNCSEEKAGSEASSMGQMARDWHVEIASEVYEDNSACKPKYDSRNDLRTSKWVSLPISYHTQMQPAPSAGHSYHRYVAQEQEQEQLDGEQLGQTISQQMMLMLSLRLLGSHRLRRVA